MPNRQHEVQDFVRKNCISLLGLVETKVRLEKSSFIFKNLLVGWQVLHNYNFNPSGRIWVLWNPEVVDVKLEYASDQIIHTHVTIIEK